MRRTPIALVSTLLFTTPWVLVPGCSTPPTTGGPTTQAETSSDGTGEDVQIIEDTPEIIAPDVEADVPDVVDVAEAAETAVAEVKDTVKADVFVPTTPQTPLRRLMPALLGQVLATVDSTGFRVQLVGGLPIEVLSFAEGDEPTSPVALETGLLCWDVNKNGQFDAATEDFDNDAAPTPADCELHPGGPSAGRPGFILAVNSATGCILRAVTSAGVAAWETSFTGSCEQPTVTNGTFAIVPVTAGSVGVVKLLDARSGVVKNQVTLPSPPTTPAAFVGDGKFGIGMSSGVASIGIATGGGTSIFVNGSAETAPERTTAVFRAGTSTMGVVTRRPEDPAESLGTRIRVYVFGENFVQLPVDIVAPGPIWSLPVSAVVESKWYVAAGGRGFTNVWSPSTGSLVRSVPSAEGITSTTLAMSYGADGRIYTAESDWNGDPALRAGTTWWIRAFDPRDVFAPELVLTDDAPVPLRWLGAPLIECDIAVLQIFVDAPVPSYYEVPRPCAGGLAPGGFARPYGDNGNGGVYAPIPTCASGPGVVPCKAAAGCEVNTECDDSNACTIDTCVSGSCSYKFFAGCCSSDEQCDDFDPCTENRCVTGGSFGKCQYPVATSCCESSSDCDDFNTCTEDTCEDGQCEHFVDKTIKGCCTSAFDCLTNLECAEGFCTDAKICELVLTKDCCNSDAMCDDGLKCTKDTCTNKVCSFAPDPTQFGCCTADADCDTGNICLVGTCDVAQATCTISPIDGCCVTAVACNDKMLCTKDECVEQKCTHTPDLTPKGCCDEDADCTVELTACILGFHCDLAKSLCVNDSKNCDDKDDCTNDSCLDGECIHTPKPGCCTEDSECDDQSVCTFDTCDKDFQACTNGPLEGCCEITPDCEDGASETTETCVGNVCVVHRCDEYDYTSIEKPLDLVFVVDQSTSMNDEIALIRIFLNDLATWIETAGVDYHVILVASRKKGGNVICIDPPLAGPNCQNSARFVQIDEPVSSHDGLEQIMGNIDEIESFMRSGSTRQFVMMSDDISNVSDIEFQFFLAGRPGYEDFIFHAYTGFDGESCALKAGEDYINLAEQSGGLSYDICSATWQNSYTKLGDVGKTAGTSFALPLQPLPGTVQVTYDGQLMAEGTAYTYDPATNRIVWVLPAPTPGKVLTICLDGNAAP